MQHAEKNCVKISDLPLLVAKLSTLKIFKYIYVRKNKKFFVIYITKFIQLRVHQVNKYLLFLLRKVLNNLIHLYF